MRFYHCAPRITNFHL